MFEDIKKIYTESDTLRKLIFVNIGVFVLLITATLIARSTSSTMLQNAANEVFYLSAKADILGTLRRPWSVVTHMFTHLGVMHILFNMIMLFFSGSLFIRLIGRGKLLTTYFLAGISGLLLLLIVSPFTLKIGDGSNVLGASAATMGVLIAVAAYAPNTMISLPIFGEVRLKYLAAVLVILDYAALVSDVNIGGHLGHLGGALYGLFLGLRLRNGKDFASGLDEMLVKSKFSIKRKSKLRVVHRRPISDENYNAIKADRKRRLDQILDKINRSGPDSLTKEEKAYLEEYSNSI